MCPSGRLVPHRLPSYLIGRESPRFGGVGRRLLDLMTEQPLVEEVAQSDVRDSLTDKDP